jgi:hypothetical protein
VALRKIQRILTDCGTEDTTWYEEAIPTHEVEKTCNRLGVKQTTTNVKHPWTNGKPSWMNPTLLPSVRSDIRVLKSCNLIWITLWIITNYRRTYQGYRLKKNGFRKPAEAHLQKNLT